MSRNARTGENGNNVAKMAYMAKMAEMAKNRQIVNKISNEMAKGPFRK